MWAAGKPVSISLWIKPAALQSEAVIFSRGEGDSTFRLMLDQGVPVVEVAAGAAAVRSANGNPLPAGSWSHLSLVADAGAIAVFVNGEPYGTATTDVPSLATSITLGGAGPAGKGFAGEIDELRIANAALPPAAVKLAFINQSGSEASLKLLSPGQPEGGEAAGSGHILEHVMLFGDIANNMMFDGWIAVGVCVIMITVGWTVAIKKFVYLNKIEKGNEEFLRLWKSLSTDLTALDHSVPPTSRPWAAPWTRRSRS